MRVNGPSPQLGVTTAKVKKSGDGDGGFELPEDAAKSESASGARASSTSSLGSLIAAQLHSVDSEEWEEQRRRRKQVVKEGEDILGLLDDIKIDMLAGKLAPSHVLKLVSRIDARQRNSGDERLDSILDEIELRARVELAKLKRRDDEEQTA
ncbi:MAG: flagellar assembly protein FliX [Pseudomonadota bacterium]